MNRLDSGAPHVRQVHTEIGPRPLGGSRHDLPVELPVRILQLCRSRSGVWRRGHTIDRDGRCVFCDRTRQEIANGMRRPE